MLRTKDIEIKRIEFRTFIISLSLSFTMFWPKKSKVRRKLHNLAEYRVWCFYNESIILLERYIYAEWPIHVK